ncbi:glucose-6-phosphate isomerase family protein [Bacteroides sp.]|uniref:glucose-6-phosphate isomerase family protein n=1 Tax=Bacteroides sp. TaxID=29523 RepID=UPI002626E43D|nr:glucose-6-phosphate isomerase family protein [Bacteroides sp.]
MHKSSFDKGIEIDMVENPLGFVYGKGVFGPTVENRRLGDIRSSLMDPTCDGPDVVYSIAMDVGKDEHKELLQRLHLLFGVVAYAKGRLGMEPIRSQGHIHKISPFCQWSTPEIYEIWNGEAVIYMQEFASDNPGKCYAVRAKPGDVVVVPPYWVHATISANADEPLVFGAWCDREYGFEYDQIRRRKGIAWYPVFEGNELKWIRNANYCYSKLIKKRPGEYGKLGIEKGKSIYRIFEDDPDAFSYVPRPELRKEVWINFEP